MTERANFSGIRERVWSATNSFHRIARASLRVNAISSERSPLPVPFWRVSHPRTLASHALSLSFSLLPLRLVRPTSRSARAAVPLREKGGGCRERVTVVEWYRGTGGINEEDHRGRKKNDDRQQQEAEEGGKWMKYHARGRQRNPPFVGVCRCSVSSRDVAIIVGVVAPRPIARRGTCLAVGCLVVRIPMCSSASS